MPHTDPDDWASDATTWDEHKLPVQPFVPPPPKRWTPATVTLLCLSLAPTVAFVMLLPTLLLRLPLMPPVYLGAALMLISLIWSSVALIVSGYQRRRLRAAGLWPDQIERAYPSRDIAALAFQLTVGNILLYLIGGAFGFVLLLISAFNSWHGC